MLKVDIYIDLYKQTIKNRQSCIAGASAIVGLTNDAFSYRIIRL
jgi:hypothetical protein